MELDRPKVFIVESEPELIAQFQQLLTMTGYDVRIAPSKIGAAAACIDWKPGIILVEEILPDGTGLELLEEIRSAPEMEELQAILLTDNTSENLVITALARGVVDIIKKPFSMAEIILRVGNVVKREKHRVDLEDMKDSLLKERKILLQYFSEDVVSKIVSGDLKNIMGESITATILFADIRNFTSISETLEPKHVAELLSILFTDIMDIIFSHNGSVNKLLGDGILATFGCPFGSPNDADNAVKCALSVRDMTRLFNTARPRYLKDPVRLGMGITTGKVFAGNIGSYRRMEYTVIGDAVNTASRLQALTKRANVDLLIDGATRESIPNIPMRRFRATSLRGKKNIIDIYTIDPVLESPSVDDITFF